MAIELPGTKGSQYTVVKPFRFKTSNGGRRPFKVGVTVTLSDVEGAEALKEGTVVRAKLQDYEVIGRLTHDGVRYKIGSTVSLTDFQAKPLLRTNTIAPIAPAPKAPAPKAK